MQKRTVLITGANSGIGFATVKKYLTEGYIVVAHYHNSNDYLKQIENDNIITIKGHLSNVNDSGYAIKDKIYSKHQVIVLV